MKKLILYIAAFLLFTAIGNAQGTDNYSALEIGYPVSLDLPQNIVFGINGRTFIYNGNKPIENVSFKEEIVKNFALIVAGSDNSDPNGDDVGGRIVSRDLGLGSSDLYLNLPDYVFEADYQLTSLEEMQDFVQKNKHLPGIINQKELKEQGYFMVEKMLFGQLKNLEELVLHTIAQEKKIQAQEEENKKLRAWAETLEKRLEALIQSNK
jgi:hypothetical protein